VSAVMTVVKTAVSCLVLSISRITSGRRTTAQPVIVHIFFRC